MLSSVTRNNMEFWREFFRLYRSMPELWQIKTPAYRNHQLKARSYQRLLEYIRVGEPKVNIHTLKRKINNLRTSYRRELRKLRDSKADGSYYVPTLWYFKDLDFLATTETEADEAEMTGTDHSPDADEQTSESLLPTDPILIEEHHCNNMNRRSQRNRAMDIEMLDEQTSTDAEDDDFFSEAFNDEQDTLEQEPESDTAGGGICLKTEIKTDKSDHHTSQSANSSSVIKHGSSSHMKSRRRRRSSDEQPPPSVRKRRRAENLDEDGDSECELIGRRMAAHFRNMRTDQRLYAERIISEVLVYGRMNRLGLEARFLPSSPGK